MTAMLWVILALLLAGCGGGGEPGGGPAAAAADEPDTPSNRIAVPPAVRRNLGVTFVEVERRRVEKTLRVPGAFELVPTARREYRTMLAGRVELLVEQFDAVEAGAELYRVDSPSWRELQQRIADADSAIRRFERRLETFGPLLEAHRRHEGYLAESIAVLRERADRLESLRDAGGGRAGELARARAELAQAKTGLSEAQEKDAQLAAARAEAEAELAAARSRRSFLLDSAASLTGLARAVLEEAAGDGGRPRWARIDVIPVRAEEAGVVEALGLTNGAWADEKTTVLAVVQPRRLRFYASGLQSDLGVLRDGLPARIVPPTPTAGGRAVPLQDTMEGTLALGLSGDPAERTVDLFVSPAEPAAWARPGVAAQLEIVTDPAAAPQLAIPLAAVQRDGLVPVIFRRAPDDPNEVIRLEADLGRDDGRWVEVLSGLRDGDRVVLDGAFQLMLSSSGSMQKGGHFHADGTFHEEDH